MENYLYFDEDYPKRYGPFIERWKELKGFEGVYYVSDYGNIKHITKGVKQYAKNTLDGYIGVTLSNKKTGGCIKKRIHVIVAQYFLKNPENKKHINHKLGIKDLNCAWEIEWCTHKENMEHARHVLGKMSQSHRMKTFYMFKGGVYIKCVGIRATAKKINLPHRAIQSVLNNKIEHYKGYIFSQNIPVEYLQEQDLKNIKRHGQSDNR